jgi:outer membrane protein
VENEAQLSAVRRLRESAERARDTAQERFNAGDLPVTEWREAQAQADLLRVQELDASEAAAVANETYASLTGLPPPASGIADRAFISTAAAADPTVGSQDAPMPAPLADWLDRARRHSPTVAMQREQQALAEADLRRYTVTDGLQLNIVGQYGRDALSGSGSYGAASSSQRVATVGVQVSMPLFTGGMRSAQRHAATASLRAARADAEGAEKQIDLQVRAAWLAAGNARARLNATLHAQASADSRLDATRVGHDAGDRTLLEVLAAEGFALQSRAGAIAARCEGLLSTLRLEAAAGSLSEQTLREAASGEFVCGALPAHY